MRKEKRKFEKKKKRKKRKREKKRENQESQNEEKRAIEEDVSFDLENERNETHCLVLLPPLFFFYF